GLGLVEPELVLAELVVFLHRPAASAHGDQHAEGGWGVFGNEAVEVCHLAGFGQAAADQQEVARAGGAQPGEGVAAVAFRTRSAGDDLPGPAAEHLEGGIGAHRDAHGQRDLERAGHAQHVADAVVFAEAAQLAVTAVHGVGGAPTDVDTGGQVLREQLKTQFGLGVEAQRGGDAHLRADLIVSQVLGRYVEPGPDQRVAPRCAVGGVDEVDRICHLAGAPTYCRLTPAVWVPVFSSPLSSSTSTVSPCGSARCSTTKSRTVSIASSVFHDARSSSRCIRSGVRSPAYSARVQQFLRGRSLISPRTYLPACRTGSTRVKYAPSRPISSASFCSARSASTMTAAATS